MAIYKQCITDQSTIQVTAGYPTYPSGGEHGGIDTVHVNHQSYAPMGGVVDTAHVWQGGTSGSDSWGNYIVVKLSDNSYWLAAHFASQIHKVGDTITRGQYIGEQGKTGNVTGIHTHWEYWAGGHGTAYRTDPSTILGIPNAVGKYDVEWDAADPPTPPVPPTPTKGKQLKLIYMCKPAWRF